MDFIDIVTHSSPVFLNFATTLDTKLSLVGERLSISNHEDWSVVHNLRSIVGGILVGSGTVMIDDPSLRTKIEYLEGYSDYNNPIRFVIDRKGRLAHHFDRKVFSTPDIAPTYWITSSSVEPPSGVFVIHCREDDPIRFLLELAERQLAELGRPSSIMVEGGASIISASMSANAVDYIRIFKSTQILGAKGLDVFPEGFSHRYKLHSATKIGDGLEVVLKLI